MKKLVAHRLTERARKGLARIAEKYGISLTAMLEVIIRDRENAEFGREVVGGDDAEKPDKSKA